MKFRKASGIILRSIYTVQAFVIAAQLDMDLQWDWGVVFTLVWIYLSTSITHTFVLCVLLIGNNVATLIRYILQGGPSYEFIVEELTTCFWKLLYSELDVPILIGSFAVFSAVQGDYDNQTLKISAIVAFCASIVIIIYTAAKFDLIIQHVELYHVIEILECPTEEEEEVVEESGPVVKIELQVEKKEKHFVKVAGSYFVPLEKDLVATNNERKKKVKNLFFSYFRTIKRKGSQINEQDAKLDKQADLASLRRGREYLDQKIGNLKEVKKLSSNSAIAAVPKLNGLLAIASTIMSNRNTDRKEKIDFEAIHELKRDRGWAMSVRNNRPSHSEKSISDSKRHNNDEKLCYICYENTVNAILMDCGHAGVCFECACKLIEKKNECMECRARVDEIVRFDINPILEDIHKGLEFRKVVIIKPTAV